jgi:hypothetical protein
MLLTVCSVGAPVRSVFFFLVSSFVFLTLSLLYFSLLTSYFGQKQMTGSMSTSLKDGSRRQPGLKELTTTPYPECTTVVLNSSFFLV